jgi:hypothetical protein
MREGALHFSSLDKRCGGCGVRRGIEGMVSQGIQSGILLPAESSSEGRSTTYEIYAIHYIHIII